MTRSTTSSPQTALITGASRGIGRELAKLFARDGHHLVLVARSKDELETLAASLRATHNITVDVIPTDLADDASRQALHDAIADRSIDVLVNNAGFGSNGAFHTLDLKRELAQIEVNIVALTDLTGHLLPGMVERGRGWVLNIASTAGFQAGPYMAVYYATKAYVISFTEAIAYELKGTGVTATAHCPGATETAFATTAGNDKTKLFTANAVASAEAVAKHAYRTMWAGKTIAIHGAINTVGAVGARLVPRTVTAALAAHIVR
ncbi:MAG: SDR family oxidoreductase [Myxococcota bacterium]